MSILAEGGLNASDLGAGKTLTSVEACRLLQLGRPPRILVVAPPTILDHWRSTFVEQFPSLGERNRVHIVGTHRKDTENWSLMTRKRPGVYIIGWNAMHGGVPEATRREASRGRNANAAHPKVTAAATRKAISKGQVPPWTRTGVWDLVIMDEVHRACNRHGVPYHVLKLIKGRKLGLSATPGGNEPQRLWAILNILWPDKYTSFWDWANEKFHVSEEGVRGAPTPVRVIGEEIRPGSTWEDIPAVVRVRTEEVYDQLPPVIEREVRVSMTPEQEEQYRDFEDQCLAWLGEVPVATPLPIEQRIRLRQAALGTLKAEEAVHRIDYKLNRPQQKVMQAWQAYLDDHADGAQEDPAALFDEQLSVARLLCIALIVADFLGTHCADMTAEKRHLEETRFDQALAKQAKLDQGVEFEDVELGLDISYDEEAAQPKLDAVKEILADLPEGEPLLVWTHSAKWARMAEKKLGSQAVSWTMKATATKREKIKAGFGTEWRVLIAQLQSLSEGVDWLKDVCRCEVIASPTEDEVKNQQAEGRLRRPGQKSPVQRWRLVSEGTIDEDVNLANLLKRGRMSSLYKDDAIRKERVTM
ncbi:SNF2-related protein [Streptomyces sp. NEAU-Y11]|nr:SNF2-related protein [Streptomyces sp. NEAU-Y11]